MRKRMLQLVGALFAVGALIAAPSAATGDAPSKARTAGNGCNSDHTPPSSRWGRGWYGHDGNGRPYWRGWGDGHGYFGGRAYDPSCDALHPGKLARVMVAVDRLRGSRCQPMFRSGHLGTRGNCARTHWFHARGTRRWGRTIPNSLPHGRYRLHRRAVDAAGNSERDHVRHLWVR
jgi:hypothetical protein